MMKKETLHAVRLVISGLLLGAPVSLAQAQVFTDATWSENKGNNDRLYTYSDSENEFRISDASQATAIFMNEGSQVHVIATQGSNRATDNGAALPSVWWGAWVNDNSSLTLEAAQNNEINGMGTRDTAVYASRAGKITLIAGEHNILTGSNSAVSSVTEGAVVTITGGQGNTASIAAKDGSSTISTLYANMQGHIFLTAKAGDNEIKSTDGQQKDCTISAQYGGAVTVIAEQGSNKITSTHLGVRAFKSVTAGTTGETIPSHVTLQAAGDNSVTVTTSAGGIGVQANGQGIAELMSTAGSNHVSVSGTDAAGLVTFTDGTLSVTAESGDNDIETDAYGIYDQTGGSTSLTTGTGTNRITAPEVGVVSVYGAQTRLEGKTIITSATALLADAQNEDAAGEPTGNGASISLQYDGQSSVQGDVKAYNKGHITIVPREDQQHQVQRIHLTGDYQASSQDVATGLPDPSTFVGGQIDIHLTDGSTFTGTAMNASRELALADRESARMGTFNLQMEGSSLWTMTGSSSISRLSGTGGTVHFVDGGRHLEITEAVSGSHRYDMDLSYADKLQSDMLYARTGTADHQTLNVKNLTRLTREMNIGDAVRYATVMTESGGGFLGNDYVVANGIYNDTLRTEYRVVTNDPNRADSYDADFDAAYGLDGATNIYLVKTQETKNDGAVTPGRNRDLIWRYVTDLDTFTKRDGQSQYFTPGADQGGWVRLGYCNLGVDGVGEIDGNTYELGWTTVSRQNEERKDRFSASVAYGKPSGRFEGYGGDLTVRDFSVNLYDTHEYYPSAEKLADKPEWKKESHAYWDNYLKYHHVKTEYNAFDHAAGTRYSGDYDQNVWNLSTEYGHKLMLNEDWFWVPQAQLQLSYLGGYDYVDSQGLYVDGDHDWSFIGRLGFDVVRDFHDKQNSKLYFKASLLHEFLDGNDVTTRYGSDRYVNSGDQSGTWGVVGLGYSSRIGENQYFYVDAERYFGNDFKRTYDIRAGVNWKF